MSEVLSHPWMLKGFEGPPNSHVPPREPLRAGDLDQEVITGMTGFEFGTSEQIENSLNELLSKDLYIACLKAYDAKRGVGSSTHDISDKGNLAKSPTSKRFSGLDFYRKKLTTGVAAAFSSGKPDDTTSDSSNPLTTLSGIKPENMDPTRGFHPLISVYFLVREKIEREKVYGPGVFASSTLSLNGPPLPPLPEQAYQQSSALPAPPQEAFSNGYTPATSIRMPLSTFANQQASKPIPMEDRRRSMNLGRTGSLRMPSSAPNSPSLPQTLVSPRTSIPSATDNSAKRRTIHLPSELKQESGEEPEMDEDLPLASPGSLARRFGSLLGRATSISDGESKRHRHRSSISGSGHRSSNKTPVAPLPQVNEGAGLGIGHATTFLPARVMGRANTISMGRSRGHSRGVSLGSAQMEEATNMKRSDSFGTERLKQDASRRPRTTSGVPSVYEQEEMLHPPNSANTVKEEARRTPSPQNAVDEVKPIYLKGLFSVATTTTKQPAIITEDLVSVLDRFGVQHRPIKAGFECVHVPSIDFSSVSGSHAPSSPPSDGLKKPPVKRRGSRLGLTRSPFSKDKELDKDLPSVPLDSQGSLRTEELSSSSFTALNSAANATDDLFSPSPKTGTSGQFFGKSSNDANGVQDSNSDLVVRFDIFIVKVPWLPGIHGLQFRRRAGNAWTYSQLGALALSLLTCVSFFFRTARRILADFQKL